jgi:uncharacterized membrane protein
METILNNEFATLTLLYGALFILGGLVHKLFPPKKMTWYYGVQTKSARRNEETWKEATLFVSTPAIIIGLLFIGLAFLPYVFENASVLNFKTAMIIIPASLLVLHYITVRHLNKLFDKAGNRINNN